MVQKLKSFEAWIKHAVELGLECLDVSTGETIVLLEDAAGQDSMFIIEHRGEHAPDDIRQTCGRETIETLKADSNAYALVWPGLMDGVEDEPVDVIVVEAGNQEGRSAVVTQRYKVTEEATLEKIGTATIVAKGNNLWTIAQADSRKRPIPANIRVKPPDADSGVSLEDLAYAVTNEALERMQKGNEIPFACLVMPDSDQQCILGPKSVEEGETYVDVSDSLREVIAENDDASMYALAYFGTEEVKGKVIDLVVVETGDRTGAAPVYVRKFKVSKSLELKTKEMEFSEEIDNLWQVEEEDAWTNEED